MGKKSFESGPSAAGGKHVSKRQRTFGVGEEKMGFDGLGRLVESGVLKVAEKKVPASPAKNETNADTQKAKDASGAPLLKNAKSLGADAAKKLQNETKGEIDFAFGDDAYQAYRSEYTTKALAEKNLEKFRKEINDRIAQKLPEDENCSFDEIVLEYLKSQKVGGGAGKKAMSALIDFYVARVENEKNINPVSIPEKDAGEKELNISGEGGKGLKSLKELLELKQINNEDKEKIIAEFLRKIDKQTDIDFIDAALLDAMKAKDEIVEKNRKAESIKDVLPVLKPENSEADPKEEFLQKYRDVLRKNLFSQPDEKGDWINIREYDDKTKKVVYFRGKENGKYRKSYINISKLDDLLRGYTHEGNARPIVAAEVSKNETQPKPENVLSPEEQEVMSVYENDAREMLDFIKKFDYAGKNYDEKDVPKLIEIQLNRYWIILKKEMIEEGYFSNEERADIAFEKIKEKLK